MKNIVHSSDAIHSQKKSPLTLLLSIVAISAAVLAVASIMGCSLPY